jgi:hypothetical protein
MTRPDRYPPRPMRPESRSAVPRLDRSSSASEGQEVDHSERASHNALTGRAGMRTRRRWLASRLTLVALSLVLLGISIPLALARQTREISRPQPPAPSPSPAPPRIPFTFAVEDVRTSSTGTEGRRAARDVADDIQSSLSGFYDQVFLDPLTWTAQGIPAGVWDVFAETLRDRASADADALTLGEVAAQVAALEVTRSSLDVRVLLDPRGRPQAAMAEVVFRAAGSIAAGQEIKLVSRASFIFRPSSGVWLIVGYPNADTTVKSVAAGAGP